MSAKAAAQKKEKKHSKDAAAAQRKTLKLGLKKKQKKKIYAPKVPKLDIQDITSKSFRKNVQGRENIKFFMKKLYDFDCKIHPQAPAFEPSGHCRLKFEGASAFTWVEIHENSAATMEFL